MNDLALAIEAYVHYVHMDITNTERKAMFITLARNKVHQELRKTLARVDTLPWPDTRQHMRDQFIRRTFHSMRQNTFDAITNKLANMI